MIIIKLLVNIAFGLSLFSATVMWKLPNAIKALMYFMCFGYIYVRVNWIMTFTQSMIKFKTINEFKGSALHEKLNKGTFIYQFVTALSAAIFMIIAIAYIAY